MTDKEDPDLDQFFTSDELAHKIVLWSNLRKIDRVLEPSCGDGAFAKHIVRQLARPRQLSVIDIDPTVLSGTRALAKGAGVTNIDFLKFKPRRRFDVTIMNPPYSEGRDVSHVEHALSMSNKVIALVRLVFLCGTSRATRVFLRARMTRVVYLSRRPNFHGPSDVGHGARHDYAVIELDSQTAPGPRELVMTEWWL